MRIIKDLTGQKFGKLTALEPDGYARTSIRWKCQCECGNFTSVGSSKLTSGHTRSCGCLVSEKRAKMNKERATHNATNSRLYRIYYSMRTRCYNPNKKEYSRYGGRGIQVCEEWLNDFTAFQSWALENGYSDSLSIDRINNDGHYEPSNCRWATAKMQANNRSYRRT